MPRLSRSVGRTLTRRRSSPSSYINVALRLLADTYARRRLEDRADVVVTTSNDFERTSGTLALDRVRTLFPTVGNDGSPIPVLEFVAFLTEVLLRVSPGVTLSSARGAWCHRAGHVVADTLIAVDISTSKLPELRLILADVGARLKQDCMFCEVVPGARIEYVESVTATLRSAQLCGNSVESDRLTLPGPSDVGTAANGIVTEQATISHGQRFSSTGTPCEYAAMETAPALFLASDAPILSG